MKKLLFIYIIACTLQACNGKHCDENCEKSQTAKVYTGSNKTVVTDTTKGISCSLTTEELDKRKMTVLSQIKSKILEKKELKDGYSFKFDNSDQTIDMLTDFAKTERHCCNFFNFAININNDGFIWFDLTGPKEAKEMINSELAL